MSWLICVDDVADDDQPARPDDLAYEVEADHEDMELGDRRPIPTARFRRYPARRLTPSRRPSRSGENQMIFSAEKVRLMQRSGPASGHRATAEPIGTSGRSGVLPPIHGLPGGLRRNRHLPPAARLR